MSGFVDGTLSIFKNYQPTVSSSSRLEVPVTIMWKHDGKEVRNSDRVINPTPEVTFAVPLYINLTQSLVHTFTVTLPNSSPSLADSAR